MRRVAVCTVILVVGLFAPIPAAANNATGSMNVQLRNPWMAAGLSIGVPVGLAAASLMLPPSHMITSTFGDSFVLALASPLSTGVGHAYAGDPGRGLMVSALVPTAIVASAAGGAWIASGPLYKDAFLAPIGGAISGAFIGLLSSFAITAWDAFNTAQRFNDKLLAQPESQDGLATPLK